ncbi:winged helix-turn-helix transcriptional regulator [Patescibacteria group bacterium]|nr:winged helix-turn-helix transcriptional regulator [Patescibacteria group bacterium]
MFNFTKQTLNIFEEIKKYGPIRSSELANKIGISNKNLYKHLGRLLDERLIEKQGQVPRVYYLVSSESTTIVDSLDINDLLIEQNYIYVSPMSKMIRGVNGFGVWCKKNNFEVEKEKHLFVKKFNEVSKIRKNGVISAKYKLVECKNKQVVFLDHLYYGDFYTVDHFGKTKLGQLVYVGKSSQNKEVINEVSKLIREQLAGLIQQHKIQLIGFIPPTIDRKLQFLSFLENRLKIDLPKLSINKIPSSTKVAQKTLHKLEDRIINAKNTIAVNPNQEIEGNVLLIDDAVGSGATLNQTAGKIKKIAKKDIKVIGYSVVGSIKGFEVISEI